MSLWYSDRELEIGLSISSRQIAGMNRYPNMGTSKLQDWDRLCDAYAHVSHGANSFKGKYVGAR